MADDDGLTDAAIGRRTRRETARRAAVVEFARSNDWHETHSRQVTKLALDLWPQFSFVGLAPGPLREWLEYSALLHDIGYTLSAQKHHKHSARMIRKAEIPGLLPREREIIALVARFHRKRGPRPDHKRLRDMTRGEFRTVQSLAGVLRVADGLDRSQRSLVQSVEVTGTMQGHNVAVSASGNVDMELSAARKKSDVLEAALDCSVTFSVAGR